MKPLEKVFGKLQTDEIILTYERMKHIKKRHPQDWQLFRKYINENIQDPDLIITDEKHEGTIYMIKMGTDMNINVVVRIALESDGSNLKNSVMTFYRIREKNMNKLIEKNRLLYKKGIVV